VSLPPSLTPRPVERKAALGVWHGIVGAKVLGGASSGPIRTRTFVFSLMFGPGVGRVLDFLLTNVNFDMRLAGNDKNFSGAVELFEVKAGLKEILSSEQY